MMTETSSTSEYPRHRLSALPSPEVARQNGWQYQLDWVDDYDNPCFYRARSYEEAASYKIKHLSDRLIISMRLIPWSSAEEPESLSPRDCPSCGEEPPAFALCGDISCPMRAPVQPVTDDRSSYRRPEDPSDCLHRLAEEAAEVVPAVTKSLRFGLHSADPTSDLPAAERENNAEWILRESNDFLLTLAQLLPHLAPHIRGMTSRELRDVQIRLTQAWNVISLATDRRNPLPTPQEDQK